MESLYRGLFSVLECPNIKLKKPSWLKKPSSMTVFGFILITYFMVTGGVIYDVINEPPSVGSTTDAQGRSRPVAIMQWRINGQYIMEGLASSFLMTIGAVGFILLDITNAASSTTKLNRVLMLSLSAICVLVSFFTLRVFMKIKMP